MSKKKKHTVLVIADTHIPFEHPGYLDFCLDIYRKKNCDKVVHIGDLVDNHSISYHTHDPDLWSPNQEMEVVDGKLEEWFKAFPKLYLCRGNHDHLVDRKAKTVGLPSRCFKAYRDIWRLPKGWKDGFHHIIDDVLYTHGTGTSGKLGHLNAAISNRSSTVIGHCHSFAGIAFTASPKDCIFGMNVGCGIHTRSLAFAYGRDFPNKPIVACGTVEYSEDPQIHRMRL
jgi:predicted phosphodiesterase